MTATMQLDNTIKRKAFIADVHFGKFRVLEICAGYGSQALSLKNLGLDIHADIAEIDKYAIQAYNQLHGETFNYGDVYKIDETKLPNYDLITYSTPCQDFSVAGKQQGGDKGSGTRSSLLWECERIIKAVKPKYLLMENVKNLVGKKHKHNFDAWLKVLESLGYNNYWQVLNAKDYGIPQNRERVFVVSIRKDLNKTYSFPPKQELKIRLKDILESDVEEKYYLSDEMVNTFIKRSINKSIEGAGFRFKPHNPSNANISFAITTRAGGRMDDNFVFDKDINNDGYVEFNKDFIKEPTCAAVRGRGNNNTQTLEVNKSGCTNTLTSVQKDNYVVEPKIIDRIRKLTPRECWRLMGVKDEQFDKLHDISNSQLYKLAGNSIVVDVLEHIFRNLLFAETVKPTEQKGQLNLF